jgi:PST family polysaccharide transporter
MAKWGEMRRLAVILSGVSGAVRLCAGFLGNKILAVLLGPAGFGQFGNVQVLISFLNAIANGGISPAIVNESSRCEIGVPFSGAQQRIFSFFTFLFPLGLVVLLGLLALSRFLPWLRPIYLLPLAAFLLLTSLAQTAQSAALGKGRAIPVALLSTLQAVMLLPFVLLLVRPFHITGFIWAQACAMAVLGLPLLYLTRKSQVLGARWLPNSFGELFPYFNFFIVVLGPALISTVSALVLREGISRWLSPVHLGLWQSMFRLSDAYQGILIVILTQSVIPVLLRKSGSERKRLVQRFDRFVLLLILPCMLVSRLLSGPLLTILYSTKFLGVASQIPLEVAGDFIKTMSVIRIQLLIYNGRSSSVIKLELLNSLLFPVTVFLSIKFFGFSMLGGAYLMFTRKLVKPLLVE